MRRSFLWLGLAACSSTTEHLAPPQVLSVRVVPGVPVTGQPVEVQAEIRQASEQDLDVTTTWEVDGEAVAEGPSLDPSFVRKGASITAVVKASDGTRQGVGRSAPVQVLGLPPGPSAVEVWPADPYPGEALWCERVASANEVDGDEITYRTRWYVDDEPAGEGPTVEQGVTVAGQAWTCEEVAIDGDGQSEPAQSRVQVGSCLGAARSLAGDDTQAVRLADLDRDGLLDVVFLRSGELRVRRSLGAGAFEPVVEIEEAVGDDSQLEVVDIDQDGLLDVVFTHAARPEIRRIEWSRNVRGRLQPSETIVQGVIELTDLAVGDADGDGLPDLFYANGLDEGFVWALWNEEGQFDGGSAVRLGQSPGTPRLAVGDVDVDGRADVVVGARRSRGAPLWFRSQPTGFEERVLRPGMSWVQRVELADLDGDGDQDLLGVSNADGVMVAVTHRGEGAWGPVYSLEAGLPPGTIAKPVDLDEDGDLDVVWASAGAPGVWWNERLDGAFAPAALLRWTDDGVRELEVGDVDGDGDPDVVAVIGEPRELVWLEQRCP